MKKRTIYSDGWSGLVAVKPLGMKPGTGLVECRVTTHKSAVHPYGTLIYTPPSQLVYKTRVHSYHQLIVSVPEAELFA